MRRRIMVGFAMLLDVACLLSAIGIGALTRLGASPRAMDMAISIGIVLLPLFLFFAQQNGAYTVPDLMVRRRSVRRVLAALVYAVVCLLITAFFWKVGSAFSRTIVGMTFGISAVLLIAARLAIASWARHALGEVPYVTIFICDGVPPLDREQALTISAADYGLRADPTDQAAVEKLGEVARQVDSVVVDCLPEHREAWAFMLKALDIPCEILIPEITRLAPLGIMHRSGRTSLLVSVCTLSRNQRYAKRAFDLVLTSLALVVLAPVMVLVALAIRLESPGPIFFRQERVGLGNRMFRIWKFRSMFHHMADAKGNVSASRSDPRITRVGAFIRRTSLDELPQLLNVLSGDMSIVGPRPHAIGSMAEEQLFWDIDDRYWHRHAVKPGLTGLAQVRGYRGATLATADLTNRLQSDLEYVANWSLLKDIVIILRTFAVLSSKGAF